MLQTMRDLAQSWVFKTLMAVLVVSFGIWGIGDIFRGNPQQRTVARVGDYKISVQDLQREFKAALPQARRALGPELTEQQALQIGVMDRTLNIMVEHAKFDQEAKRLGIAVSDQAIMSDLASDPQFRTKDGHFNNELWQRVLQKAGYTEQDYLSVQSKEDARRLMFDAVSKNAEVPQILVDNLYQALGRKRIAEILAIHDASMTGIAQPDDKVLEEFYKAHEDAFAAPEYRTLTVATLSADEVGKETVVSDDDVKKAYEAQTAELTMPEQRDVLQAVLQDEDKAKALAAAAKNGGLADAAKAAGVPTVPLNRVDEKSILPELYTSVFAMDEGQTAGPIKSPLGWHVLQLQKIHAAGKLSFDEAKGDLADNMKKEKSADAVSRKLNDLDDELAAGHSLEDVADTLKLRLVKVPAIDSNGQTPDGKTPEEVPDAKDVQHYGYEQAAGETSQVIDDKKGHYIVVRTDEITPAHTEAFEKVRAKVIAAWMAEQQSKQAATQSEDIAKAMRDGKAASSFAAQTGVDIRVSKPISPLGDTDKDLPPQVVAQILKMKTGDVVTAAAGDAHYVLRLQNIMAVDPAKPDPSRIKVVDEMNDKLPLDLLDQYAKALNARFPIEIDQALLESLKRQGS